MKILYIANGNGLNPDIGGSLCRSIEIAKRLKELGCQIHFLTTVGGYRACQNKKLDAYYHILSASILKKEESGLTDRVLAYIISTTAAFWVVPRLPKCDVVYSDSDYFCDTVPAVLYKKKNNSVWVAMTHHRTKISRKSFRDLFISFFSFLAQLFSYFIFKKYSDLVFTYRSDMGKQIKEYLIKKGIPASHVKHVTNGVDLNFIQTIPERKKIYDACFVGGLRPNKGIYDIVPIWKEIVRRKKKALLILVGGGVKEYESYLRKQIKKEDLSSQVKMVGAKSHDKTIEIIKQSKIFISPSYEEGWGTAICEAMACKVPVVAYNLPVYRTVFEDSIKVVPLGAVSDFADAVLYYLNNHDLCIKSGLKGYNITLKYDWDKVAGDEFKLFNQVMRKARLKMSP